MHVSYCVRSSYVCRGKHKHLMGSEKQWPAAEGAMNTCKPIKEHLINLSEA